MKKIILIAVAAVLLLWAISAQTAESNQESYFELGVTASMVVSPSIGYWWDRKGIRLSGMYMHKELYEYSFNLAYETAETQNAQHSINLLTRWVVGSDPGADYDFASTGIAYALNYKGFFLEIGIAVPWQDNLGNLANDPFIPTGYWGYIHRFK